MGGTSPTATALHMSTRPLPCSARPRRPRTTPDHIDPDPRLTHHETSVRVTTIPALLSALDDNAVTDIVVANGTYHVSPAGSQRSDSLWIGARFAGRTRAGHGPRRNARRCDLRRRRGNRPSAA